MKPTGNLRLGIVVGRSPHPQATLDNLWSRALESVEPTERQLSVTAAYVAGAGPAVVRSAPGLELVPLVPAGPGRLESVLSALSRKGGPLGIAGRLARDNWESRQLAKAVARSAGLQTALLAADVVVAADVAANRAVWQLRCRTAAPLVHGPIAMMHALRRIAER
ncbi:hypothetical protein [Arthrobacter sp. U41]|uniref:hypothetical protein n=1 Tax=Arthrobacter sp. U41 TaxID=1849032 RepID=UPI0011A69768|nr:hypothetical protein [Arthrobacter sp. U41]